MGLSLLLLALLTLAGQTAAAMELNNQNAAPQNTAPAAAPSSSPRVPAAVPASRQMTNAAIITIQGPITAVTTASFKRRVDSAISGGADGIIVELNTPGGEVQSVTAITSIIKGLSVPTIAWVNPDAYSGGAIIALACNSIVASRNATMGDAAPISFDPIRMLTGQMAQLSSSERSKILSPLLAEVVDSARRNGHDEILVQSFLMLGVHTWMVEDTQTGQMHFLTAGEYEALFGKKPTGTTPLMPSIPSNAGVGALTSNQPDDPEQPGIAPLTPAQKAQLRDDALFVPAADLPQNMIDSVSLGLTIRSTRPDFASADPDRYRLVRYITDGTSLLTLGANDLQQVQLVDPNVFINTRAEMASYVGATNVRVLNQTWSESAVEFMTQGMSGLVVKGVLVALFLLCLFIEMAMPGLGVAGVIAVIALLGLIVPPLLINAAIWWTVAAILIGITLILLEIFVFPGFGAPGAIGVILVLVGLVGTFADAGQMFPGAGTGSASSLAASIAVVLLAVFGSIVGMYLFTRYTKIVPFANLLVLSETSGSAKGTTASAATIPPIDNAGPDAVVRIGDLGVTTTPLRPSGTAEFNDQLVDVVAAYGFIDAGQKVRVSEIASNRVVVEPEQNDESNTRQPEQPTRSGDGMGSPYEDSTYEDSKYADGNYEDDDYQPISFT